MTDPSLQLRRQKSLERSYCEACVTGPDCLSGCRIMSSAPHPAATHKVKAVEAKPAEPKVSRPQQVLPQVGVTLRAFGYSTPHYSACRWRLEVFPRSSQSHRLSLFLSLSSPDEFPLPPFPGQRVGPRMECHNQHLRQLVSLVTSLNCSALVNL